MLRLRPSCLRCNAVRQMPSSPAMPPRRVCPLCGDDDSITVMPALEASGWRFTCVGRSHASPYQWEVEAQASALDRRDGIGAEWGVYDDLLHCLEPGAPFVEHGVVEHRYKLAHPDIYLDLMIPRWGHVAQGPRKYSVTAFLASILGILSREGLVCQRSGPATGFFHYDGTMAYWALPPCPTGRLITWAEFASSAGIDPLVWSLSRS